MIARIDPVQIVTVQARQHSGNVYVLKSSSNFELNSLSLLRANGLQQTERLTVPDPISSSPVSEHDLEKILGTILRTIPDALIMIDIKGNIVSFSASAERLFGYEASNVIGQNISCLMAGDDEKFHDRYISNYIKSGEAQIIGKGRIVEAKQADGTVFPVHLTIGETTLDGQHLFTGYVRDLTEQQAQTHRLSQLQTELAGFARLSTAGTMASAMAHELNQPLTAIANYLEAARDMVSDPSNDTRELVHEALEAAAKQSIRAGQIVRRLRDFVSRGEFETRPSNLKELIEDAVRLSKLDLEGEAPRIIQSVPDDIPDVRIDRIQIRQVLLNLIRNAHDALKGTESPTIWVSATLGNDSKVIVSIRDNGPGISLENGRSPFEPFQSSKPTGMGLGLSICQGIVEAHDGTIWVENATDQTGATFSFTLNIA